MALTATINVSGIAALRYILTDNTTFFFTNGVDGQKLTLTLQQDGTGSRTVASGNCPGIMAPATAANQDTTMALVYDSANNTWNCVPQQNAPGSMALNTTTTNTSINWARGTWLCSGTLTMTITNPLSGPPGVGNDGEEMIFIEQAASALKITMGTTQTMNGTGTSVATAAAIGCLTLQAWGGKVYVVGAQGTTTIS